MQGRLNGASHQFVHLGLADLDLECSTVCHTQAYEQIRHPVQPIVRELGTLISEPTQTCIIFASG